MSATDDLLKEINDYCRRTGMSATTFGRLALKDPMFVGRMQRGRSPRLETVDRIRAFMNRKAEPDGQDATTRSRTRTSAPAPPARERNALF